MSFTALSSGDPEPVQPHDDERESLFHQHERIAVASDASGASAPPTSAPILLHDDPHDILSASAPLLAPAPPLRAQIAMARVPIRSAAAPPLAPPPPLRAQVAMARVPTAAARDGYPTGYGAYQSAEPAADAGYAAHQQSKLREQFVSQRAAAARSQEDDASANCLGELCLCCCQVLCQAMCEAAVQTAVSGGRSGSSGPASSHQHHTRHHSGGGRHHHHSHNHQHHHGGRHSGYGR